MVDAKRLSKREQEVADLLLQGKSNKQIAVLLGISLSTVEFHLKNIYAKLGVGSRSEAILKLGKSTGVFGGGLGETTVAAAAEYGHNGGVGSPTLGGWMSLSPARGRAIAPGRSAFYSWLSLLWWSLRHLHCGNRLCGKDMKESANFRMRLR